MKTDLLDIRNCDCMDMMREFKDNHFELAIVDPPYGIGESGSRNKSRGKLAVSKDYKPFAGDDLRPPEPEYFSELFRVSKSQIMWGANHYINSMVASARCPSLNSPCWIVWDKRNGDSDFADCELAWTSFKSAVRQFTFLWNGMLRGEPGERIHPTQKPVALYKWLLQNYAKEGDKILDTHMGSGSIAIACHYMGFNLTACELDTDYYNAACERIKRETAQTEFGLT